MSSITAVTADLTRGPVLLGLSLSTAFLAMLACGLRFFVRVWISHDIGLDDYSMGVTTFVASISTVFSIIEGTAGTSARALEYDVLGQPWYIMGATLAKISICLLFLRLVGGTRAWRLVLMAQIILMAAVNLTYAVTTSIQCSPIEKLWNPILAGGECWDPSIQLNIGYFRGAFSVFFWLFLALFPIVIVRDLNHYQKLRWPLYCLSTLSLSAGILATTRTYQISQIAGSGIFTYDHFLATLLAILEQNIGMIAANVLLLGPIFSRRQRQMVANQDEISVKRVDSTLSDRTLPDRTLPDRSRFGQLKAASNSAGTLVKHVERQTFELSRSASTAARRVMDVAVSVPKRWESKRGQRGVDEEAWPKGIIKTVEVEVTVEDERDGQADGAEMVSKTGAMPLDRNEWDRMMRDAAPSRTGH